LILRAANLTLCPFDQRHADQTRAWVNDCELARWLDRARPVSEADHQRWYTEVMARNDCVFFAIETHPEGRHAGNVWLWNIDSRHRKAEARIVIGPNECQSKGLGSEALGLLANYARDRLNLHRLYAYVLGINPRARRAFEKAGFVLEGVLRQDRWVGDCFADVFFLGNILDSSAVDHQPSGAPAKSQPLVQGS
jgi:RimJ/RimL family protein N-acetyltransferase